VGPWEGKDGDVPVVVWEGIVFASTAAVESREKLKGGVGVGVGYRYVPGTPLT
jgi:hypothetical protein